MTTGQLIRAERRKADMTQRELGEKIGVSATMICTWEQGMKTPRRGWIDRIAAALGVNPSDLFPGIEPDESNENFQNALLRLKNAPIVHDGMGGESEIVFQGLTARWRDAVGCTVLLPVLTVGAARR